MTLDKYGIMYSVFLRVQKTNQRRIKIYEEIISVEQFNPKLKQKEHKMAKIKLKKTRFSHEKKNNRSSKVKVRVGGLLSIFLPKKKKGG